MRTWDFEKVMNRMEQDKEFNTTIASGFMDCIVPGTYSMNMWKSAANQA